MIPLEIFHQLALNDPFLASLDLSGHAHTLSEIEQLAIALQKNDKLESLNLRDCRLTDAHLIAFIPTLKKKVSGLRELHLSGNHFNTSIAILFEALGLEGNTTLQRLFMLGMELDSADEAVLSRVLFQNVTLLQLEVTCSFPIERYLERNRTHALKPKIPFDDSLLEEKGCPPQSSFGPRGSLPPRGSLAPPFSIGSRVSISVRASTNVTLDIPEAAEPDPEDVLKNYILFFFQNSLDKHIAKETMLLQQNKLRLFDLSTPKKRNNPQNLRIIVGCITEWVVSLTDLEKNHLKRLIPTEAGNHKIMLANFTNYLLDRCNDKVQNLVKRIIFNITSSDMHGFSEQQSLLCVATFMEKLYQKVIKNHQEGLVFQWLPASSYSPQRPLPRKKEAIRALLEDAFRRAAAKGDLASTKLLKHYVANLNFQDNFGLTVLDYAQCHANQMQDKRLVEYLIAQQTPISKKKPEVKKKAFKFLLDENAPPIEVPPLPENHELRSQLFEIFNQLFCALIIPELRILHQKIMASPETRLQGFFTLSQVTDEIHDVLLLPLCTDISEMDLIHLISLVQEESYDEGAFVAYLLEKYQYNIRSMLTTVFQNTFPTASRSTFHLYINNIFIILETKSFNKPIDRLPSHREEKQEQKDSVNPDISDKEKRRLVQIWTQKDWPSNAEAQQKFFEIALVNAVIAGSFFDLEKLIRLGTNVNVKYGPQNRTAIHHAVAIHMSKTPPDSRFFDALNAAGASLFMEDKDGNTPLDLWDFEKNPNEALFKLKNHINSKKSGTCCSLL